ncbi:hypothetical protein CSKR_112097 [Clonorchis sinensis]|uniref:Uncharacterized protein n=1 Tax=Clonorchis sinensis TaxID=79923 RepID=A0A419Q2S8_CLOSI|nr:hypothetical protein CSKR_112097 [Clonorchis sinensis]
MNLPVHLCRHHNYGWLPRRTTLTSTILFTSIHGAGATGSIIHCRVIPGEDAPVSPQLGCFGSSRTRIVTVTSLTGHDMRDRLDNLVVPRGVRSISESLNPVFRKTVLTIEPGYCLENQFGIRTPFCPPWHPTSNGLFSHYCCHVSKKTNQVNAYLVRVGLVESLSRVFLFHMLPEVASSLTS